MKKVLAIIALLVISLAAGAAEDKPKDAKPVKDQVEKAESDKQAYGCFRDLRWGMNHDQAEKALGVDIYKGFLYKKKSASKKPVKVGGHEFHVVLIFDDEELVKVSLTPNDCITTDIKLNPTTYTKNEYSCMVDTYHLLKPGLEKKYGKPKSVNNEEALDDPTSWQDISQGKESVVSTWETKEGRITLQVAYSVFDAVTAPGVATPIATLVYEKKAAPKDDLDL